MEVSLNQHLRAIEDLCRKHGVKRLELIGSAAQGTFDPRTSDFDFLVLYDRESSAAADDRYFGLQAGLESLLGRQIDLIDIQSARNPYLIASALKHRVSVYAA